MYGSVCICVSLTQSARMSPNILMHNDRVTVYQQKNWMHFIKQRIDRSSETKRSVIHMTLEATRVLTQEPKHSQQENTPAKTPCLPHPPVCALSVFFPLLPRQCGWRSKVIATAFSGSANNSLATCSPWGPGAHGKWQQSGVLLACVFCDVLPWDLSA